MRALITSDIHCTDNPRDSYRFGLFPWLRQQQEDYDVDLILLLGDLTNDKDRHSSILVNKFVEGLSKLKPPIFILRANHDGIDPNLPFFKFLNSIPGLKFFIHPEYVKEYNIFMLPHQTDQASFENAFKRVPDKAVVMLHQTLTGAISETGSLLTGLTLPPEARRVKAIYSGDIHAPQTLHCPNGDVVYIGSPYHVRFGDQFKPRVLLLDGEKQHDLHFPAPRKLSLTIRDISEIPKLNKGDQVKIILELPRSEAVEWINHKQAILDYCKEHEIEIYGTELKLPEPRKRILLDDSKPKTRKTNNDYFDIFCAGEKVPKQIKDAGSKIIGEQ